MNHRMLLAKQEQGNPVLGLGSEDELKEALMGSGLLVASKVGLGEVGLSRGGKSLSVSLCLLGTPSTRWP